jgi:hypothetical protein
VALSHFVPARLLGLDVVDENPKPSNDILFCDLVEDETIDWGTALTSTRDVPAMLEISAIGIGGPAQIDFVGTQGATVKAPQDRAVLVRRSSAQLGSQIKVTGQAYLMVESA